MTSLIRDVDNLVADWTGLPAPASVDAAAHALSSAADRSKLWVAVAVVRGICDERTGKRAAARALITVAFESAVIHSVVKRMAGRARPARAVSLRFGARRPPSSSFPSGHAASAASAAILLSEGMPGWGVPLAALALAVGWARLQTGLHYFSDVVVGFAVGTAVATVVKRFVPLHSFKREHQREAAAS